MRWYECKYGSSLRNHPTDGVEVLGLLYWLIMHVACKPVASETLHLMHKLDGDTKGPDEFSDIIGKASKTSDL